MHNTKITFSDGSCECCLAMINMANGTDIYVWFVTHKSFLLGRRHGSKNSRRCTKPSCPAINTEVLLQIDQQPRCMRILIMLHVQLVFVSIRIAMFVGGQPRSDCAQQ